MEPLFYLQDARTQLGTNVVFWNKGGAGYGTNLNKLEIYTLEKAQQQHNRRSTDIPLLKSLVDKLSILAVDMQVLPITTRDINNEYCIQIKNNYNGNDIKFIVTDPTKDPYNYKNASILTDKECRLFGDTRAYKIFSKTTLDKITRKTFQVHNINKRKMCTTPGIKLIKPKRVRPTTGKTRSNCPNCGKIVWDYNPHEPMYCNEECIDEAKTNYKYYY